MSKRKIGIAAGLLLLLIVGAVWAIKNSLANSQMEKVKQMQEGMAKLPPDQRRQGWDDLRKEMGKLSDSQREQLRDQRWADGARRMNKQIDDYFAAPPNKRNGVLDKQIADEEKHRKEREARRAQGGQGGGQPGWSPGGPNSSPTGQGPNAANAGRQPGGGQPRSPEARSADRNRRLDNSSPAQRARQAAYSAAMQKRRIELGLPPSTGRPFGGR
jgi:hypothetical protein